jgi:HD superfamily phosphodiesterase
LEEKIIWDADKIDLMGMLGISRVFHWGGETDQPFDIALQFCYEWILPIHDLLNTQTAKTFAERRHREAS